MIEAGTDLFDQRYFTAQVRQTHGVKACMAMADDFYWNIEPSSSIAFSPNDMRVVVEGGFYFTQHKAVAAGALIN